MAVEKHEVASHDEVCRSGSVPVRHLFPDLQSGECLFSYEYAH